MDHVWRYKSDRRLNKFYKINDTISIANVEGFTLNVEFLRLSQHLIHVNYADLHWALKSLVDVRSRFRDEQREFSLAAYFVGELGGRHEDPWMKIQVISTASEESLAVNGTAIAEDDIVDQAGDIAVPSNNDSWGNRKGSITEIIR